MSNRTEIVERASDGTLLPIAALDVTLSYAGSVLQYKEVTLGVVTYRKTFSYDGSNNLVKESRWVRK